MINIKTQKEIEIMQKGGKILGDTLWEILKNIKPGVSEIEIDALAERLIKEKGGESGFKKVEGYKHTICVSTNDVCVHGIPGNYKFKEGDVVGIDCGVYLDGFHTDMSQTIRVKSQNSNLKSQKRDEVDRFLEVGENALNEAILEAKVGNRVGHISRKIQKLVEFDNGYSIVRTLVGHGVGHELHEEPEVPGYLMERLDKTPLLKEGMVIAVEVIYNMGKPDLVLDRDDWTLRTKDGSLSGLFERTIAITKTGPIVLTP